MPHNVVGRKLAASDLFNCSDLSGFVASIIQILPFKGVSLSHFYDCEIDGIRFLTKMSFYRKTHMERYGVIPKNVMSETDAEINILIVLKEKFTDNNVTPCIIELVYYKICNGLSKITPREKICEQLVSGYKGNSLENDVDHTMCTYRDLVKNNFAHDKCAFLVLDKCDMTLDHYLRKSINTPVSLAVFKSLLFQIIYTVYAINKVYPGFRHYDLHTENIMLKLDPNYKFKATNPKFLIFTIDGEQYSIPYFGIIPKIIDFGLSTLPEEGLISVVTADRMAMYYRSENDLLFLFHHITHTLYHKDKDKLGRVDKILQHLEPNRAYVQYYTEHIRKLGDKIPTYEQMIKNHVWDEYKKIKVPNSQIYNSFTPLEDVMEK